MSKSCLVNNVIEGTETDAEATDDDTPAAESKNWRRPHPASRFEVLFNCAQNIPLNGHLRTCYSTPIIEQSISGGPPTT